MNVKRFAHAARLLAVGMLFAAPLAVAQDAYPGKPITLIVPQAAGGANDTIARIFAQKFAETLGQPVVIENRVGAGGNIGTVAAAKAPKDGYTLLLTVNSAHVINPFLYKNVGFDPVKDFEPISLVATAGYVLVAEPSFPARNVKELIDHVKAKPGMAYASAGNGTLNHLLAEMLKMQAGIDMQHIPYKSAAASVQDVVGGRVPVSFQSVPSALAFVKAGKLKVLGVANEKRVAALPDVPTIGETLAGYGSTPWYGLFAPAGTPKAIVAKLHDATLKTLANKEVQEKLVAQGCEAATSTPEQFAAAIRSEMPQWQKIVKQSGAAVD
jgi:tripartite-type tricarboxylate transporter receptor subunit TctC